MGPSFFGASTRRGRRGKPPTVLTKLKRFKRQGPATKGGTGGPPGGKRGRRTAGGGGEGGKGGPGVFFPPFGEIFLGDGGKGGGGGGGGRRGWRRLAGGGETRRRRQGQGPREGGKERGREGGRGGKPLGLKGVGFPRKKSLGKKTKMVLEINSKKIFYWGKYFNHLPGFWGEKIGGERGGVKNPQQSDSRSPGLGRGFEGERGRPRLGFWGAGGWGESDMWAPIFGAPPGGGGDGAGGAQLVAGRKGRGLGAQKPPKTL